MVPWIRAPYNKKISTSRFQEKSKKGPEEYTRTGVRTGHNTEHLGYSRPTPTIPRRVSLHHRDETSTGIRPSLHGFAPAAMAMLPDPPAPGSVRPTFLTPPTNR